MTAKVSVTLKKAVLDPQDKAVERSLAQLGLRIGSLKHFLRPLDGHQRVVLRYTGVQYFVAISGGISSDIGYCDGFVAQ